MGRGADGLLRFVILSRYSIHVLEPALQPHSGSFKDADAQWGGMCNSRVGMARDVVLWLHMKAEHGQ